MLEKNEQTPRVLIVDDINDNLVLLSLAIQELGLRVVTATNGEDAVAVAQIASPQLILMDIAMPKLDGLEASRLIRRSKGLEHVPILILTAFDTDEFRRRAQEVEVDGYMTKPLDFEKLGDIVSKLLTKEAPFSSDAAQEPQIPEVPAEEAKSGETQTQHATPAETGQLDPRFMLWRMFCVENDVPVETLPSELNRQLRNKWEKLKKAPRHLFKF